MNMMKYTREECGGGEGSTFGEKGYQPEKKKGDDFHEGILIKKEDELKQTRPGKGFPGAREKKVKLSKREDLTRFNLGKKCHAKLRKMS